MSRTRQDTDSVQATCLEEPGGRECLVVVLHCCLGVGGGLASGVAVHIGRCGQCTLGIEGLFYLEPAVWGGGMTSFLLRADYPPCSVFSLCCTLEQTASRRSSSFGSKVS